jgi:hypothetical protein
LSGLEESDRVAFLEELGITDPGSVGLKALGRAAYDLLGLQTYFTAGPQEVRAWTISKGMKAPQVTPTLASRPSLQEGHVGKGDTTRFTASNGKLHYMRSTSTSLTFQFMALFGVSSMPTLGPKGRVLQRSPVGPFFPLGVCPGGGRHPRRLRARLHQGHP